METKDSRLIEGPIMGILIQLTIPMILGGLGMVIFNVTDTYFVGQLGRQQLAALSFTFPIVMFATNIAHGAGIGVSAVVSRAIGKGDHMLVKRLTTDGLVLALFLVVMMAVAGVFTIEPLFRLLGASPEAMPYIKRYMTLWYPGMIFMVVPMVANNAIRASGDTKIPGLIVICSAVMNIVLDPMLIFGIGPFPRLEVAGAAIATIAARSIMFLLSFGVLAYKKKMLAYTLPAFRDMWNSWREILYIGVPTAGTKTVLPVAAGIMTRIIAAYGTQVVAGFGAATRIEVFALLGISALSSVMAPFVGQNYGAEKFDRIKAGIKAGYQISLLWGLATVIILACFRGHLGSVFSHDPTVASVINLYLSIVPIGYGLYGLVVISTSAMSVLRKPLQASVVTLTHAFMFSIPLAYIGSYLAGIRGVFLALPLSYLISGLMARSVLERIVLEKEKGYL